MFDKNVQGLWFLGWHSP